MARWLTMVVLATAVMSGRCEPLLRVTNAPHNSLVMDAHTLHFTHPKGATFTSILCFSLVNIHQYL